MLGSISVVRARRTPAYRQIVEQVVVLAASGRLVEGDTLPTVRALAEALALNPNTVTRAYRELAREGLIESRGTRGMVVIPRRQLYTRARRRRRVEPILDTLVSEALLVGLDPDELRDLVEERLSELSRIRNR
jgi:GntR family transcriptional regulator